MRQALIPVKARFSIACELIAYFPLECIQSFDRKIRADQAPNHRFFVLIIAGRLLDYIHPIIHKLHPLASSFLEDLESLRQASQSWEPPCKSATENPSFLLVRDQPLKEHSHEVILT